MEDVSLNKLKILMTADTLGGVWTYTMELCKALQEEDVEIHLLTLGKLLTSAQQNQINELHNLYLYEKDYKLEWMQDPWNDVKVSADWINDIYKKIKPDVIHFNNYVPLREEWKCPIITVFHSCVLTWHEGVKKELPPKEWLQYKELVQQSLSVSDIVIYPSQAIKKMAEAKYKSLSKSLVIYNGVNLEAFNNTKKKHPYVLSGGRLWDEAKNIQLLANIADKLSWPIKIAGDTLDPHGNHFQSDSLELLGKLNNIEMQQQLEEAAIFVMPAKYEPFGLSILEAASAGCAIALSHIDTYKELWGDSVLYFDPFEEESVAKTIQQLIDDKALRRELSLKAKEKASTYSATNMAKQYLNLYKDLVKLHSQVLN